VKVKRMRGAKDDMRGGNGRKYRRGMKVLPNGKKVFRVSQERTIGCI
jgi:hypothetical protein